MIRRLALVLFLAVLAIVPAAVAQTATVPDVPLFTRTLNVAAGAQAFFEAPLTVSSSCDVPGTRYLIVIRNGNADGTGKVADGYAGINQIAYAGTELQQGAATVTFETTVETQNVLEGGAYAPANAAAVMTVELWRLPATATLHSQTYSFPKSTVNKQFTASFAATNLADRATMLVTRTGGMQASDQLSIKINGRLYADLTMFSASPGTITSWLQVPLLATNTLTLDGIAASAASTVAVKIIQNGTDTVKPAITFTGTVPAVLGATSYTFTGTVTDTTGISSLTLDGQAVTVAANGTFSKAVTLTHGAPNNFTFIAYDCSGKGTKVVKTIVYDRDAPAVTVTSPKANALTRTALAVDGTGSDDSGTRPVVKVDGTTATWDGSTWRAVINLAATPEGPRNLTVVATDAFGRTTTVLHPVIVDATLPALTATFNPAATPEGWSPVGATVTFNCNDANGIQLCIPMEPTIVQMGRYSVQGTAIDKAGNMATLTQQIKGDGWAPAINLTAIAHTNQASLTINEGIFEDQSGLASVTCNGLPATFTADQYTCTVALTAGLNTVRVVAVDKVGNQESEQFEVRLDQQAPLLTIDAPLDGAQVSGSEVTVSGTATDDYEIFHIKVNGTIVGHANGPFTTTVPLTAGSNTITVEANDHAGNLTTKTVTVARETTPPTITATLTPAPNTAGWNKGPVTLTFDCADASGIATCNEPVTTSTEGEHQVTATATDNAGNVGTATFTVRIDTQGPAVAASPDRPISTEGWAAGDVGFDFVCLDGASGVATCPPPVVLLASNGQQTVTGTAVDQAGNSGTADVRTVKFDTVPPLVQLAPVPATTGQFTITVNGTVQEPLSGLEWVTCDNTPVAVTAGDFQCTVSLGSGTNTITVVARDRAANRSTVTVNVTVDETAPTIAILSPDHGFTTSDATIRVSGQVTDGDSVTSLTVAGVAVSPAAAFATDVALADGINDIAIVATDAAGNSATKTLRVTRFAIPKVAIATPVDLDVVRDAVTTVTGTVNDPNATVTVNDVPATISNGTFSASGIPLAQGRTVVTAIATNTLGRVATASINIYRDSIPPRLIINSPEDGATVYSSPISISGTVDDIVVGTINANQMRVTVNGQPAQVSNRAFFYPEVPLAQGLNTILIAAIDEGGNQTTLSYRVTLATPATPRLELVSGDGQKAAIGSRLAAPVVVQALSPAGTPLAAASLTFEIVENDGTLHNGSASARKLSVTTGADGRAGIQWTLGMRAGAGNNRLRVSGAGYAAPIEAAAVATAAVPALIVVDSGNDQFAITGDALPRPLVAVVVDAGNNRLSNVPVTFTAAAGGGTFDGQPSVTVSTDSDGRAIVTPSTGPEAGQDNNVYNAGVSGLTKVATFRASGKLPGLPANTRIAGVVLDNSQIPIAGVTVRIDGTPVAVQTDAQGQFTIQPAPVGYVKLFVDGSTAQRAGTWPTLEYAMYTLAGIENDVGMPIYLLPIDTARGVFVDDTTGGTLTLPELPGFALKVAPGSVTFPGGGRTGTVSATLVHADRIPMAPGFGQQPKFIVTIQPAGAHFDPPAQLTFPNVDGLRPSEVTEMYSFDHDLGQFIAIGTATVSADGTTLTSDPGVGIIKGGWHCGGNPAASGTCDGGGGGCESDIYGSCEHPNKKPCKSYVCEGGECTEVDRYRMEVKFVNRDDASRADWAFRQTLTEGSPLYGGYGGDTTTADWVRFQAIQTGGDHTEPSYTWTAIGPETIDGPAGEGPARQWDIEGIMWKPGRYEVSCRITYGEECEETIKWTVEIGIRTSEYIVYGGIKREDAPAGLADTYRNAFNECPLFSLTLLNATFGWPNENEPDMAEPWSDMPHDQRVYFLYRIIQVTSDEIIHPDPNGTPDNNYGLSGGRNFRFLARAQYKYLVSGGTFRGNPTPVGPILTRIGATTAPCGTSWTGMNIPGENPPGNGRQYFHNGKWTLHLFTRASLIDRIGYERLTHRELPYAGVRLRFRADSPRLATDFNNPSRDWEMKDEGDFSMVPTISFYRRYYTPGGGWQLELVHRTTQRLLDFTGIGPVTRQPAFLP
ncbi:MAG TPA: HYR domain-containing protein [Thermoanaerobaculia bacterium]